MIVVPVKPGHDTALDCALANLANLVGDPTASPFAAVDALHFCRFVVLPAGTGPDGSVFHKSLIFSTCYDPPFDRHLELLVTKCSGALSAVLGHCVGCQDAPSPEELRVFLTNNRTRPNTFYVGVHGRSVSQLRDESALRESLETFIDSEGGMTLRNQPAQKIRAAIQEIVKSRADALGWAAQPDAPDGLLARLLDALPVILRVLLALVIIALIAQVVGWPMLLMVLVGALVVAIGAWVVLLHRHEADDRAHDPILGSGPNDKKLDINLRIKHLAELEDLSLNNQFSSLSVVKPGVFRRLTLWTVLTAINFVARYFIAFDPNSQGRLSDIPTIHFARWIMVDNGRRLFFESNYTGSWERYLGDFVDKAASGLTAVWSNTVGFPPSTGLVGDGARDEQPFKRVARVSQIETQVWYAAYKDLTVKNVLNNRDIHRGLFGLMDDAATRAWLNKL